MLRCSILFTSLLGWGILLVPATAFAADRYYQIPTSIHDIVQHLLDSREGTGDAHSNFQIPPLLKDADLEITGLARPHRGYYRGHVTLLQPLGPVASFKKWLEIQQRINPQTKKPYLDVHGHCEVTFHIQRRPFRWLNRVPPFPRVEAWVARLADRVVLRLEEAELRKLIAELERK